MKAKRPIKNLASGKGGVEYVGAELLYSIFGIPHDMVSVFNSHKIMSTFLSGQGDAFVLSASSTLAHAAGKVTPIVVLLDHRSSHVPGVPSVMGEADHYHLDAGKKRALRVLVSTLAVHRAFFAPPGVPADRLAALRDALRKVSHEAAFHKEAKKEGLFLGYSSPAKLRKETQYALAHQKVLEKYLGTD